MASPRGHTSVSTFEWLVNPLRYRIERRMLPLIASEAHEGDFVVSGRMRCLRVRKPYNAGPRVIDFTHQGNQ